MRIPTKLDSDSESIWTPIPGASWRAGAKRREIWDFYSEDAIRVKFAVGGGRCQRSFLSTESKRGAELFTVGRVLHMTLG